MTSEKCPNCGAGITLGSSTCEYCGSVLTQTVGLGHWTDMKKNLPPVSPTDPSRSINVLGCFGMNGGRVKKKDGTVADTYPGSLMPVYYDFQAKEWKNDFYGIRMYPIGVTHWMPLPSIGSPDWIPVVLRIPQVAAADGFSTRVLACDKSLDYEGSVISAQVYFHDGHWVAPLDLTNSDEDALGHITVSHWMPIPDRPLGNL